MQELEKILEEMSRQLELSTSREYRRGWSACKERMMHIIRKHMNDGWISVDERLPEEKVNPITRDFYEYQVTVNFGFGEDVRTYKYGNGHWWHGPGIVDQYVIAWRERPDPYYLKRRGK